MRCNFTPEREEIKQSGTNCSAHHGDFVSERPGSFWDASWEQSPDTPANEMKRTHRPRDGRLSPIAAHCPAAVDSRLAPFPKTVRIPLSFPPRPKCRGGNELFAPKRPGGKDFGKFDSSTPGTPPAPPETNLPKKLMRTALWPGLRCGRVSRPGHGPRPQVSLATRHSRRIIRGRIGPSAISSRLHFPAVLSASALRLSRLSRNSNIALRAFCSASPPKLWRSPFTSRSVTSTPFFFSRAS